MEKRPPLLPNERPRPCPPWPLPLNEPRAEEEKEEEDDDAVHLLFPPPLTDGVAPRTKRLDMVVRWSDDYVINRCGSQGIF